LPSSAPIGSFHPIRFCPCWAHASGHYRSRHRLTDYGLKVGIPNGAASASDRRLRFHRFSPIIEVSSPPVAGARGTVQRERTLPPAPEQPTPALR
jgi:hypothetical protein